MVDMTWMDADRLRDRQIGSKTDRQADRHRPPCQCFCRKTNLNCCGAVDFMV